MLNSAILDTYASARDRIFDLRLYQIPENIHKLIIMSLDDNSMKSFKYEGVSTSWQAIETLDDCLLDRNPRLAMGEDTPCSLLLVASHLAPATLTAVSSLTNPCVGVYLTGDLDPTIEASGGLLAAPLSVPGGELLMVRTTRTVSQQADSPVAEPDIASNRQIEALFAADRHRISLLIEWLVGRSGAGRRLSGRMLTALKDDIFKRISKGGQDEEIFNDIHTLLHGKSAVKAGLVQLDVKPTVYPDTRAARIAAAVERMAPPTPWSPQRIVDIGCDDGMLVKELAKTYSVGPEAAIGMDLRPMEGAQEGFTYMNCSATQPQPELEGRVDLIVISMTLHHISNWKTVMANAATWLTPGGCLVVREHEAVTNVDRLFLDIQDTAYVLAVWPAQEMAFSHHALTACSWFSQATDIAQAGVDAGLVPYLHLRDNSRRHSMPDDWEARPQGPGPDNWVTYRMVYYMSCRKPAGDDVLTMPQVRDGAANTTGLIMDGGRRELAWLFSEYDIHGMRVDKSKIKFDAEGLRFVCTPQYAEETARYIDDVASDAIRDAGPRTLVDATGGLGGNAIGFDAFREGGQRIGFRFDKIVSVELDAVRHECLEANLRLYNSQATPIHGNALELEFESPETTVFYADPPWGGDDYAKMVTIPAESLGLLRGGDLLPMPTVVRHLLAVDRLGLVVVKVPFNYDARQLVEMSNPARADVHRLYQKVTLVAMWGQAGEGQPRVTFSESRTFVRQKRKDFGRGRR